MDKQRIKETMLGLERQLYDTTSDAYLGYIASARLDRTEPIENDELAQAIFARDLSEAFDQQLHDHAAKIRKLQQTDFGPKTEVEEGAVIAVAGRHFVIAVATNGFVCEGIEYMGISSDAPLYRAIEGKAAGDSCTFNGRDLIVEMVW